MQVIDGPLITEKTNKYTTAHYFWRKIIYDSGEELNFQVGTTVVSWLAAQRDLLDKIRMEK